MLVCVTVYVAVLLVGEPIVSVLCFDFGWCRFVIFALVVVACCCMVACDWLVCGYCFLVALLC